jgi:type II secretory pathway pseudopilin PulG
MMRISAASCIVLAVACGDNLAASSDAAVIDAVVVDAHAEAKLCSAVFTGNFTLSESVPANCASLSGSAATFSIPAFPIGTSVDIAIGLPTPTPTGAFSSDGDPTWSASATQSVGDAFCYYVAGATSVPSGTFSMTLDSIDLADATAHGTLMLELAVLPEAETNCGSSNAESLQLSF